MTEKTISPTESNPAAQRTSDAPVQLIVATPLNNTTQFKLPIDAQQVQSVQSVDLDLVITTVTGEKIILQQGALQAAVQPDSQIVFSNGKSISAAEQIKKIGVLKPVEGGSFRLRSEDVTPTQADNVSGKEFGLGQDVNDAVKQLNETAQQIEKMLQSLSTASTTVSDSKNAMPQGQGPGTGFKKASDVVANPLASPTPGSPPVPENTNTSEQSGKDRELRASSEYKVTNVTLSDATKTLDAIQPRQMMAEAPLKVELKAPTTGSAEVKPQWADGVVQNTLLLSGAPTAIKAVYSLAQGTTSVPADFKINGQSLVDKPLELVVKGGATQHLDLTWKVAEDSVTVQKTDFQVIVKYYNAAGTLLETGGQTLTFSYGDFRSVSETYANDANGQPIFNLLARGVSYDINGNDNANDVINAGDGHDIVRGLGGNDSIFGGRGDDTLIGGMGADTLDGGTGNNTASYITSPTGVTVHTASAEQSLNAGGEAQGDVLINIQNLVGSDFADALWGDSRANTLSGGKGDDTLDGGSGADQLIGGEGNNTASYASAQAGVTVSLANPDINTGDAAGDKYTDIQNLLGSAHADTLIGDSHDNILSGGAGDDTLQGGPGKDTLDGGDGQDTASYSQSTDAVKVSLVAGAVNEGGDAQGDVLINIEHLMGSAYDDQLTGNAQANMLSGGLGNDTLEGGVGADHLDGGAGNNTASYAGSSEGVTVYLAADHQLDNHGGDAQGDVLTNIQNLTGSAYADTLVGDEHNNILSGGGGNDTLEGGGGGDVFDGGTGTNTVTYAHAIMGVSVYLDADHQIYNAGPDASGDTFTNIQNLIGTEKNDVLVGDAQNNLLQGGGGDDVLEGGLGADTLQGGEGHDTVSYENATQGVTASLGSPAQNVAEAAGDTYSSIENLRGTQFDDKLTGDAGDNTLQGLAGNDTLDGGGGINNLIGGTGDDTYIISNVADTIVENINEGKDQVSSSVTYTLGSNIENLTLTGAAAINGTGNGLGNVITGNSAENTLDGAAGADTMIGGAGNDTYVVDDAGDVITENAGESEGKDLVQSSITYTLAANLENLTLTGNAAINGTGNTDDNVIKGNNADNTLDGAAGNDNISGNDGNDKLLGGDGNDTLDGGDGNDTLDGGAVLIGGRNVLSGGAGDDTYIVSNTTDEVSEGAGQGTDEVQSSVTYILGANIEKLTLTGTANIDGTGNGLDNIITGNDGNNALNGGDGKDTINGGAGNDTLNGGAGDDSLTGGLGDDTYVVDSTADVIVELAGGGTDTVQSSATYVLGSNIENLTLTGTSAINGTGNALANVIMGNSADNELDGGGDGTTADTLVGGAGNDTYTVHSANDVITEAPDGGLDTVKSALSLSLSAVEYVENLTLTGTAISGTGNALANVITGNGADNILDGGGTGGTVDTLIGGAGNDTYIVHNTKDEIKENAGEGTDLVQTAATYILGANLENLKLTGDANIDGTGNDANNTITGNKGNNILMGGVGADALDGGEGSDTASYAIAAQRSIGSGVTVTGVVASLVDQSVNEGDAKGDTYSSIENLTGSAYNDKLIGDGNANILKGGSGDDILIGGAGADTLYGGLETDTASGGVGSDTASYTTAAQRSIGLGVTVTGVVASLVDQSVNEGDAKGDTYSSIENLTGSDFNDKLIGDGNANILKGGSGDDILIGGAGADTLYGGLETDTATGGAGSDTASYATAAQRSVGLGVTVTGVVASLVDQSVNEGDAKGDIYSSIENLTGSAYNDKLIGDGNANILKGGSGDDILIGGAGADTLYGGLETDTASGGAGSDTASYATAAQRSVGLGVTVTGVVASLVDQSVNEGDAKGDIYSSIENLTGSDFNDKLIGDGNANILIRGKGGQDVLDGGDGSDTASYATAAQRSVGLGVTVTGVVASLVDQSVDEGDAKGDIYSSIENLTGSAYNDKLIGDGNANILKGGSGDDILIGGAGADTLYGGLETDTASGGAGSDTASYETASARIIGTGVTVTGVVASLLAPAANEGDAAGDTYTSIENLTGSAFNDKLTGDSNANTLKGDLGDDTLSGGAGADSLIGGDGNDLLIGEAGNDTMIGGTGNDTYVVDTVGTTGDVVTEVSGASVNGTDTVQIKGITSFSLSALQATNIEILDLKADANTNTTVDITSAAIQRIVGIGDFSVLSLRLGTGDIHTITTETGVYVTDTLASATFYSDAAKTQQIAQVIYA